MEAYLGIIGKVFMTIIFRKNRRTEVFSSAACVHSICFNVNNLAKRQVLEESAS